MQFRSRKCISNSKIYKKHDKLKPRHVLHNAVMKGNIKYISLLLDRCKSSSKVNQTAGDLENTALHLAAKNGDVDIATILINKGADIQRKNKNGKTALHIATNNGHHKLLKLLLSRGSRINELTAAGMTSLHIAVKCCSRIMIEELLRNSADVRTQNILGDSPLHDALKGKCKDSIELLVSNGAPINVQNKKGESTLHIACLHCDDEIVQLLLNKNADCNALTTDGSTPLHYAIRNAQNYKNVVPLLINAGARVWVMNRAGEVPLTIAIKQLTKWYSCDFIGYLLGKGLTLKEPVDQLGLNFFDNMDKETIMLPTLSTVFTVAIKYKDRLLFDLLIKKGIPINYKNQFCTTPLLEAVIANYLYAAQVLLQLGADPNAKDSYNKSALRLATSEAMTQLLVIYNADVNEANLFHRLVKYKKHYAFDILVETGVDINKMCSRGYSVLHYALLTEDCTKLACILYAGVEPEEFFRIFLDTYEQLKISHSILMIQQLMIFYFQGIVNDHIMELVKFGTYREIYNDFIKEKSKMMVTRICEDFPVTYYDLLMKRGEDLVRILRIQQIRDIVTEHRNLSKFVTFAIYLRLCVYYGLRRLKLKNELEERLGAFIPSEIGWFMSKYFNNSNLLKFTYGLRRPSEDFKVKRD